MNSKEILQRLFYIDKLYEEERTADKSNSEIEETIKTIKKKVSLLTKEEIKRFEVYEEANVKAMSKLIADGRVTANVSQIMQRNS